MLVKANRSERSVQMSFRYSSLFQPLKSEVHKSFPHPLTLGFGRHIDEHFAGEVKPHKPNDVLGHLVNCDKFMLTIFGSGFPMAPTSGLIAPDFDRVRWIIFGINFANRASMHFSHFITISVAKWADGEGGHRTELRVKELRSEGVKMGIKILPGGRLSLVVLFCHAMITPG
jgi:hypothetical protein